MAESTWARVALPILEHIATIEDDESHSGILSVEDIAGVLGQPAQRVQNEVRRLHTSGYLLGKLYGGHDSNDFLVGPGLSDLGARAVGKWPPNDPYGLLVHLLEQRISSAPNREERSRWQRIRDGVVDIGTSGAGGLVVELTKAMTGLQTS
ncbi:MAG: hypothetical protein ACRD0K_05625 [Egibacteraceae bacterium]